MFTGLVQDVGTICGMSLMGGGATMSIETTLADRIAVGDSVAVNGVCLTATEVSPGSSFTVDLMNATLVASSFGNQPSLRPVNLELAMRAADRLGGHIVQGHVDGVGVVVAVKEDGIARRLRVELPAGLTRYVIEKGSITLDGVSLTVADLGDSWAEVSLIPETLERTNLGDLAPGDRLNVECDVVAKYVERLMSPFARKEQT
ncbi:MAG TPA: riboflavin synthase [Solirubrobacterales bacterium]|nr:riboflavin synthase [Solirubrobacterales bacterium]